jgi:hypothetical protein
MSKKKVELLNFYEKIPKEYLVEAKNPNYNIHKIKIPFRMCVVAPSGSGKTNFILNLIQKFSIGEGTFADVWIITRNKDEPLYNWLEKMSDQIHIKEGLQNNPKLDDFDKDYNHLVIWDDLVLSKDLTSVEQYYIRARKKNVSVIFLSQSYFKIPKIIRNNCSYHVILKLSGNREVNIIMSEFGLGVTKDQLMKMYEHSTNEKLNVMIIDMEADKQKRFRKNFDEFLDPEKFT